MPPCGSSTPRKAQLHAPPGNNAAKTAASTSAAAPAAVPFPSSPASKLGAMLRPSSRGNGRSGGGGEGSLAGTGGGGGGGGAGAVPSPRSMRLALRKSIDISLGQAGSSGGSGSVSGDGHDGSGGLGSGGGSSKGLSSKGSHKKMRNILAFLDAAEANLSQQQEPVLSSTARGGSRGGSASASSASPKSAASGPPSGSKGGSGGGGAGGDAFDGIKHKMKGLRARLEDREATIELLKSQLAIISEREGKAEAAHREDLAKRLKEAKQQYETVIQRHLQFIDRLLKDKEELSAKCAQLTEQGTELEKRCLARVEAQATEHTKTLKRHKDAWSAAERVRRDNWMESQTKAIKDLTIKGLEPEIQRLISQHKEALKAKDVETKEAIDRGREGSRFETEKLIQAMKEALGKEKEVELAKEREVANMRLRDQIERYDSQMQEQRRRFDTQLEAERSRRSRAQSSERSRIEKEIASYKRLEDDRLKSLKEKHSAELEEAGRRAQRQAAQIQEQEKLERSSWKQHITDKMNGILREKEASLKKRLTAERDQQLEMVIGRLGEETHSSQKLLLAKFDRERDALVSEHVGEATRLRGQITALRAERDEVACKADELDRKLKGLSSKILTTEHDLDAKDKDGQQVRARARAAEAKLADLQLELDSKVKRVKSVCKRELEKAAAQLKKLQQSQKKALQKKMTEMEEKKSQELDSLSARVRAMMEKKDIIIGDLREQLASKERRIQETEAAMRRGAGASP